MPYYRRVNDALKKQLDTLWHTTNIYMSPKVHEYAELLASKMPGNLKVCSVTILNKLNRLKLEVLMNFPFSVDYRHYKKICL